MATVLQANLQNPISKANIIASLKYQNNLLKDRNKILALQNQNLLAKLSKQQNTNSCKQNLNPNRHQTDIPSSLNTKKQIEALEKLIKSLKAFLERRNDDSNISSLEIVLKMMENKCCISTVIDSLTQIIKQKSEEKIVQKKSDYDKISQALKKRKENFGKKQKIKTQFIHIVKDPQWHNNKGLQQQKQLQPDFIIRSSLKIAKIVKKKEVSSFSLDETFEKLRDICKIRDEMKQLGKQMSQKQRQQELGIPCGTILQQLSRYWSQLRQQYNKQMKQYEDSIHKL